MGNTVIVAIPAADDKVYRISSEKVPHLTLVSLGEEFTSDELITIVGFVEHAAKELSPFGLTVDYRDTLGPNEADVLFFEKNGWSYPRIADFRHYLLLNDTLKMKFDTSDQFPEWMPHLTLGFPETPAHKDDSEYPGINYVQFDRIAVWMDDYDGPTFRLKYDEDAMTEAAWSDIGSTNRGLSAVGELFHYGKKGMRWGVTTVDKATKPTVTRDAPARRGAKEITVSQRKAGTFVKTKGGQRQKATEDAVKAAAARQKAKKSTTDSLTNDELRSAVERMNLEQQYTKLEAKTKRRGQGFISQLFQSSEGKQITQDLAKRVAASNA